MFAFPLRKNTKHLSGRNNKIQPNSPAYYTVAMVTINLTVAKAEFKIWTSGDFRSCGKLYGLKPGFEPFIERLVTPLLFKPWLNRKCFLNSPFVLIFHTKGLFVFLQSQSRRSGSSLQCKVNFAS